MYKAHLYLLIGLTILPLSCQNYPKKVELQPDQIQMLIIRTAIHPYSYKVKVLMDKDSVTTLCRYLNQAEIINVDTVKTKLTIGAVYIDIYFKDEEVRQLHYSDIVKTGPIFMYDGSYFKSDEAYKFIK